MGENMGVRRPSSEDESLQCGKKSETAGKGRREKEHAGRHRKGHSESMQQFQEKHIGGTGPTGVIGTSKMSCTGVARVNFCMFYEGFTNSTALDISTFLFVCICFGEAEQKKRTE